MNTTSTTRLRLTSQVGQAHAATGVLLDLGTNKQPFEPKHTSMHSGNLHGLLPMLHRSDPWPALVTPVTPVRLVDRASQVGGYSSRTKVFQRASVTSLGPGTKTLQKHNLHSRKNLQILVKQLQTNQEQTSSTTTQKHTSPAVHPRQIPQVVCTGQTGQEHRSDGCNLGSS
jgi:hypothetical protein